MPGTFDERFAAAQADIEAARANMDERASAARAARTPEAREKILRQAHALVVEKTAGVVGFGSPQVIAVARFLAGEPG